MGVAAGLDDDVGAGLRREVERHHRRGSAVVGKGRFGHSRVSQRHQVGKPVRLLALEDRHWIATRRGNECGVAAARNSLALQAALLDANRGVDPRPRGPGVC